MRSGINDSVPRFTAHLKSATHVNSGESETTALGIYVVAIYRLGKTAVKDATSMAIAFVAFAHYAFATVRRPGRNTCALRVRKSNS